MTTDEHTERTLKSAYLILQAQLDSGELAPQRAHEALELLHAELKGWDKSWLKRVAKQSPRGREDQVSGTCVL